MSDQLITVNIRTQAPNFYTVKPNKIAISPGEKVDFKVTLRKGEDEGHKFKLSWSDEERVIILSSVTTFLKLRINPKSHKLTRVHTSLQLLSTIAAWLLMKLNLLKWFFILFIRTENDDFLDKRLL